MKSMWKYFLLIIILIINYSHGRYVDEWSTTNDRLLINECLIESVKHINLNQGTKVKVSNATNIVCRTHINNGLSIELSFELGQQRWECSFYKPIVHILKMKYETCSQIEKQNLPEQIPQENNANSEEEDDEAAIDKLNQGIQEKATNDKQVNVDESNKNINREETNQDSNKKQSGDEEDRNKPANNKENLKSDQDNPEALKDNVINEESNQNLNNKENKNNEEDMNNGKAYVDDDNQPPQRPDPANRRVFEDNRNIDREEYQ